MLIEYNLIFSFTLQKSSLAFSQSFTILLHFGLYFGFSCQCMVSLFQISQFCPELVSFIHESPLFNLCQLGVLFKLIPGFKILDKQFVLSKQTFLKFLFQISQLILNYFFLILLFLEHFETLDVLELKSSDLIFCLNHIEPHICL